MNYKIVILLGCFIGFSAFGETNAQKLLKQIGSGASAEKICRKKAGPKKEFFLLSDKWFNCGTPVIAALAELICGQIMKESFVASKCHKLAKKALGKKTAIDVISKRLKSNDKNILCKSSLNAFYPSLCPSIVAPIKPGPFVPPTPVPAEKPYGTLAEPASYAAIGIDYLHSLGLTGKGVKVGLIDGSGPTLDPRVKAMGIVGAAIPGAHATFILGELVDKAGTESREVLGIAPQATIYFEKSGREAAQLPQTNRKVTLQEPYFFDDGSMTFSFVVNPKDTINFLARRDNQGNVQEKITINKFDDGAVPFPSAMRLFVSETDMLTDLSNNAEWHKLLNDNAALVKDPVQQQKFKKLENLYELLGLIKDINDPELTFRARLDAFGKGFISPIEDARLGVQGISEVIVEPSVDAAFAKAIDYFRENGVSIINTSLALMVGNRTKAAIQRFAKAGGIVVKSAGNSNVLMSHLGIRDPDPESNFVLNSQLFKMLADDEKFAGNFLFVGGLDETFQKLSKTSARSGDIAPNRYLAAPGSDVRSYDYANQNATKLGSGTSFAAPMVAGILALLKEAFPKCTAKVLAGYLLDNAESLGLNQFFLTGKGRVNAKKAYEKIKASGKCR